MFTVHPLSVGHAMDRTAVEELVPVSGPLFTAYGIGAALGPIGASLVGAWSGPNGLFLFIAAVSFPRILFDLWRMAVRTPLPTADKDAFQPLLRTTPTASHLDPRADAEPPQN